MTILDTSFSSGSGVDMSLSPAAVLGVLVAGWRGLDDEAPPPDPALVTPASLAPDGEGDMEIVERIVAQPAKTGTGKIPITNLVTPVKFSLEKLKGSM